MMLVEPDPGQMAAYGISASRIQNVLQMENRETHAGIVTQRNEAFSVHLDGFFKNAEDLGNLVVGHRITFPSTCAMWPKLPMDRKSLRIMCSSRPAGCQGQRNRNTKRAKPPHFRQKHRR